MADLPAVKVIVFRAFSRILIDCCGPFQAKNFVCRSKQVKKWLFVFVCFAAETLHFEVVNDLTNTACLAALKRFCARWGIPFDIFSYNGRNFVAANKEFRANLKYVFKDNSEEEIKNYLAKKELIGILISLFKLHFRDLCEVSVESLKYH